MFTKQPSHNTNSKSNNPSPFQKRNDGTAFIQPKLNIGKPGDSYEVEADRTADAIVSMKDDRQTSFFSPSPLIQKQVRAEEEEIQAKEEDEEPVQTKLLVQKSEEPNAEMEEDPLPVQAKSDGGEVGTTSIESQLNSSKGGGSPMNGNVQTQMESGFGTDFGKVRVHTDSTAVQMNKNLGAQAFTHGSDIYFNEGKYNPESDSGKHLLAHELTHTVQQGATVKPKLIQKAGDDAGNNTASGDAAQEAPPYKLGKIELDPNSSPPLLVVPALPVPGFKKRNKNLFAGGITSQPERRNTDRQTDEVKIWKDNVRDNVHAKVNTLLSEAETKGHFVKDDTTNRKIFFLKPKNNKRDIRLVGGKSTLKSLFLLPEFDRSSEPRHHSVDHIVEYTLMNGDDAFSNFELLDFAANISSGGVVKGAWNRSVGKAVEALNKKKKNVSVPIPNLEEVRDKYQVKFNEIKFRGGVSGTPSKYWSRREINSGKHIDLMKVMKADEIEKENLRGTSAELVIYPLKNSGIPLHLSWTEGETVKKVNNTKWIPNFTLEEIIFEPSGGEHVGMIAGKFFSNHKYVETDAPLSLRLKKMPGVDYGGYIDRTDLESKLKQVLKFKPLSPLDILNVDLDPRKGLVAKGVVTQSSIEFLKNIAIEVGFIGKETFVEATLTKNQIELPDPFEVREASLSLRIGNKPSLTGGIDFEIKNVGEGQVKAKIDSSLKVSLSGKFNIASDLFDKSEISFAYERSPEGERSYTIGGKISLGKGKVKGLKKAEAEVIFGNGVLSAKGTAQPDIKGFEEIEMFLKIEKDKYEFGGKINLKGIVPRVKQGELELKVSKGEDGFKIAGGGSVTPDIPGMKGNPSLTISYNDGAIMIQGDVPFEIGESKASGQITVGITNQVVDENNQPTGEIAEEWTVYGKGKASIELGKNIVAEAEVVLQPDNQIIVSGKAGLDQNSQKPSDKEKKWEKTLFEIGPPPIILFVIPPIGASLTLEIDGGARIYASFTPPYFEELSLSLIGFNITNPSENQGEIVGKVFIATTAKAGFEMYLKLTATLSVLIAKISGYLKGSIGLEANGKARAGIEAKWSRKNGLEITDGELSIEAMAQFLAKLSGGIRVYLDLWLAEIDIWEEEIDIASVRFGDSYKVGIKLPISFKDGTPEIGSFDKDALTFPELSSESEQQKIIKQGAMEDDSMKPPPPPSQAEATAKVKSLDSGPVFTAVLDMDADEIRSLSNWGLISRDTYISWLLTKYKDMGWGQPIAAAKAKDNIDFEVLKRELPKVSDNMFVSREMIQEKAVSNFIEDHPLFVRRFGKSIIVNLLKSESNKEATISAE